MPEQNPLKLRQTLSFVLGVSLCVQMAWLTPPVQAQIPSAGDSGVIEKSLRDSRPLYKPPVPDKIPDITIEEKKKVQDAGAGATFFVRKILIEGNNLIDDETLAPLVDLGDGTEMTLGVLGLYASEITALYISQGYIISRAYVPAQTVKDGVVTIKIIEAKIGKRSVIDNVKIDEQDILDRMWRVEEGKVLKEADLARSILELNDILGLDTGTILKPGAVTGTSDLIIRIKESLPIAFTFDADNFGSEFTGRNRFGFSASMGNLLTFADRLSIRGVQSNLGQHYIKPSYLFPLNRFGTTVNLSYTYSDHELGSTLAPLLASGRAQVYNITFAHPILRARSHRLSVFAGVEYSEFTNSALDETTSRDELLDAVVGVHAEFNDPFKARTFIDLKYRKGTSEGDETRPLNSRFKGFGDTSVVTLRVTRFQPAYFLKSYFILTGFGQYSDKRVVSSNQLIIGGMGLVRGYPLAEYAGDQGYRGSLEYVLPFPWRIPVGLGQANTLNKILSFTGFIDHGKVFVRNSQPGERDQSITGAGWGVRINIPKIKPWLPSVSFSFNHATPQFKGPQPSDKSNGAYYFSGLISFN